MTGLTTREPGRRGAVPWGLVGALALVALGEWAMGRVEMDVLAPWHWDWRNTGRLAGSPAAKGSEVLGFGDSLLKFSVLPPLVRARTGHSMYNFGMSMGQTPSSYFLLRRAIRSGARPRAVVLEAVPIFLRERPSAPRHLRQWPEMLTAAEMLDLARSARDPNFLAEMAVAKLLPTFRAGQEVRIAVMNALRGETFSPRFFAAQFWRNARVNRGANVMPAGQFIGGVPDDFPAMCGVFAVDPVNADYLDRFLALAAAHQIPVVWVIPPMVNELERMSGASGFDAAHTAFVRATQRRYPDVTVIDGRRCDYGRALFHDPIHMNRTGAVAFSGVLAPLLGRALSGDRLPRWVTLPPCPVPTSAPAETAVEDINDSALVLARRVGVRR